MTQSTPASSTAGFWDSDILDMLFPSHSTTEPRPHQDTELLRQLNFVPGLKEILMLRQVHALEHATVWVLSDRSQFRPAKSVANDLQELGGMSTDRGFYLYGQVQLEDLSRAVQVALRRITAGEWDLAVHPRCGTNLSVSMLLTAGLALGATVFMPRDPIGQLVGFGAAAAAASFLAPDLGSLAQRYITTSIPFNLAIANITPMHDHFGRPTHFVQVRWMD